MTTRHELLSTIEALHLLRAEDKALIAQLQARLNCTAAQCAYCDAVFQIGDPAALDHWRDCQQHPARVELERLQALVGEGAL